MCFITALTRLDRSHDSRCFGYYPDKDETLTAVKENRGDLNEGIYDYLVVEKISEGMHSIAEEETGFRWVDMVVSYWTRGYWEEISKPPETASFANHAIG